MNAKVLLVALLIGLGAIALPYSWTATGAVEVEPNDSYDNATVISHTAKTNQTFTYTGTLNDTDIMDWYLLTNLQADYAGGTDTFEVILNLTGAGTVLLSLIDPNGMMLMSSSATSASPARVATVVHTSGKFNITLAGDGAACDYSMFVNITAYANYSSDGNDQIDFASALANGGSATDSIDNYTDPHDFYLVSTHSMGDDVDVVTICLHVPLSATTMLARYIWNETSGTYDYEDSTVDGAPQNGVVSMRFRAREAALTQYYYFRVAATSGGGVYTIDATIETYVLDHDNNASSATEVLQRKKSYTRELRDEFGIDPSDYYMVYMNASERLTAELTTMNFNTTTGMPQFELHLYDASLNELANTMGDSDDYEKVAYDISTEGYYYVEARSTGGAGTYRLNFTINYPPVITDFQPIAQDIMTNEDVDTRFNITVFDGDSDPLWYQWTFDGVPIPGAVYKMFLFKGNVSGVMNLTVFVSDGKDFTTMSWNLTVNAKPQLLDYMPSNDTPISIHEGETITFTVSASDTDQPLTYTWLLDNVVQQESSSNSFTFAPNYSAVSDIGAVRTLKAMVSDALGALSVVSWNVNIINVNQLPYLAMPIPEVIVTEDTRKDNALDLNQYFRDNDTEDASRLYFTYSGNTNLAVEIRNGIVAVTPTVANWTGSETITFTVNDTKNSFSADAVFTVIGVNDPPVVRQGAPSIVYLLQDTANTSLNLASDVFYDCDTPVSGLTFASFGNLSIQVAIASDGNVTFTAVEYWRGNETITFSCMDGSFTAYKDIKVIIVPVNHVPTVRITSPKENDEFKVRADVNFSALASDPDGDALTYQWKEGSDTIGNTESFKRAFLEGVHAISITVDDGNGGTATAVVNITIEKKSSGGTGGSTPGLGGYGIISCLAVGSMIFALLRRRANV